MFARGNIIYQVISGNEISVVHTFAEGVEVRHLHCRQDILTYCKDGNIRLVRKVAMSENKEILCECKKYSNYEPLHYPRAALQGVSRVVFPDMILELIISDNHTLSVRRYQFPHIVEKGSLITSISRGEHDMFLRFDKKIIRVVCSAPDIRYSSFDLPDNKTLSRSITDYSYTGEYLLSDGVLVNRFKEKFSNVSKSAMHAGLHLTYDNKLMIRDTLIMENVKNIDISSYSSSVVGVLLRCIVLTNDDKLLLVSVNNIVDDREGRTVLLEDATGVVLPTISTHDFRLSSNYWC